MSCGCGSGSAAGLISQSLGTAYDNVKIIVANIDNISTVAEGLLEFLSGAADTIQNIQDTADAGESQIDAAKIAALAALEAAKAAIEIELNTLAETLENNLSGPLSLKANKTLDNVLDADFKIKASEALIASDIGAQPHSAALDTLAGLEIGQTNATDLIDRQTGDARYVNESDLASALASAMSRDLSVALSDEATDLTVGVKLTSYAPYDFTLSGVFIGLSAQSTAGVVTLDIKKNGVSIFSTKPSIDVLENTSLTGVIGVLSSTAFVKGDKIEFEIIDAGASAKGLKAFLDFVRTA